MRRVLLTAFGPYDEWQENASWLVLQAVVREMSGGLDLTTRLYPANFAEMRDRIENDFSGAPYDAALHLGQAPGAGFLRLEAVAQNTRRERGDASDERLPLEDDGPLAYESRLPLAEWTRRLRDEGVPTELSRNAGDYYCNAALYWSHYFGERSGGRPAAAFVHVPIDLSQACRLDRDTPSMPAEVSAYGVRLILESLVGSPAPAVSGETA